MQDERKGLPSASGAQRYSLCRGSFLAEQGFPDNRTEDSERGDRIHAVLAGSTAMDTLSEEDQDLARKCLFQADALIAAMGSPCVSYTHKRMWYHGRWSGEADLIAVTEDSVSALVVDYKTGRGEVEESPRNMQLRALAVLAMVEYGVSNVSVAIVQPLVSRDPVVTRYEYSDLLKAAYEVDYVMRDSVVMGHQRNPSPDACKYCKANGTDRCPESRNVVEDLNPSKELAVIEAVTAISNPIELARFLDACVEVKEKIKAAEKTIEKAHEQAVKMIQSGVEIPGWTLKEGREIEEITEPAQVFGNWIAMGGDADRFQKAVSVTKKALGEVVKQQWPTLSGNESKDRVESLIAGATETKRSEPSLVRVA